MQVFLIRHPRPLIAPGICYGRLDVDCVDPEDVAAQLKSLIPANTPVISSPLRRARALAELLDPPILSTLQIDARLTEIDFGDWEGKAWDDIPRNELDAWAADVLHFVPPGGESVAQLQARVIEFAESLNCERVVLVTHAGVMRALVGYWQQLPVEEWTQLKFNYGDMTVLTN